MSEQKQTARQWSVRRFHLRVVAGVTAVTLVALALSAAAVARAEQGSETSNIKSYGDAFWWAMETVTTVGYGDLHPTTQAGRAVAGVLMMVGVALLGMITATVVTWFFSELDVLRDVREMEEAEEATEATLETVVEQLAQIQERLDQLEGRRYDDG